MLINTRLRERTDCKSHRQAQLIDELSARVLELTSAQSALADPTTVESMASHTGRRLSAQYGNACGASRAAGSGTAADTMSSYAATRPGQQNRNDSRVNPLTMGGLPRPGSHRPLVVHATALGLRPEAIPPNPETSEFFGVAHKGSALKGSRGLTFVSGDNIHEEVYTDTGPPSGSGIAKPVSPSKHFMVLQAQTPEFRCARSHSGGDHGHSSVMATNTKSPRCKRSAYTPEVGPDHPGCASGVAPSLKQPDSSGSANASPGILAHPGTQIINPGEKL